MKKITDKRSGNISLWKFIFSLLVVLYHTSTFYSNGLATYGKTGFIAVEFFFLVSGYYLFKGVLNNKKSTKNIGLETFEYITKKLKVFYPYIILCYLISLPILIVCVGYNIEQLTDTIWSLLLLKGLGMGKSWLFAPLWYLSAMLVAMMILYPLVRKYKEGYLYIFAPLISFLGLAYMYNHGSLNMSYGSWGGIICLSSVRAFIEMNMAGLIYIISEKIKTVDFTKVSKILFTILSEGMLLSILLVVLFLDRAGLYQYVMLLMMFISITIMVSNISCENKILNNKFIYYLEELSLVIFISHNVVLHFVKFSNITSSLSGDEKSILTLLIVIVTSPIIKEVITFLKKLNYTKIKKIFIN